MQKVHFQNSFSARLSLYLLLVMAVVFFVVILTSYQSARNYVREEAMQRGKAALEYTNQEISHVLEQVESAVQNMAWIVASHKEDGDYMYELTYKLLESNPNICGSAVAFEPSYFPERGVLFSPYAYRDAAGDIFVKQLGTEDYEYHYMDWYQIPKLLNEPYWSEPYYDDGGGEVVMTTYSYPLYDETGNMYAVFTADVSLEWFAGKVNAIKPYAHSTSLMISRGGTFLVHDNTDAILCETFFTSGLALTNPAFKQMGHHMVNGESGVETFEQNGSEFYFFYAPVKAAGWSVAVSCLYSEIFAGVDSMRVVLVCIGVLGLLLMGGLCYYTIRKLTNPLAVFAGSATEIAHGNFKAELPVIRSRDEMKILHDSFEYMQKSLVTYMNDLKETTANKERIESELRIANDIQMGMLPKIFPPFPEREDIDLYANLVPAKEVGGDLYDFFIEGNKFYFIVGDVSGKGVPASLVMAVTCRLFRTVASHFSQPEEIISALNNTLSDNNETNMFCTAFMGIIDLNTNVLTYCNAGHNSPVILSPEGKAAYMDVVPNLPLGLFKGFPYEGQEILLERDTYMFLYTDGVTEAENPSKELYSDERLLNRMTASCKDSPRLILEEVMADVTLHRADAEQSDDITMMCFHLKSK